MSADAAVQDPTTIGVAIAIPEPYATELTGWRRRFGDPEADKVWPHVTLLPPTDLPAGRLPALVEHLTQIARARDPFLMHLAGSGTFRPTSPVVFVQVARGVSDCELLEKSIRGGPVDRELQFPYHPHVTVAQDVDDAILDEAYECLAGFTARFVVEHYGLFTRDADGSWTWRQEFDLGGA